MRDYTQGKRLSAVFSLRPCLSAIIFILQEHGGTLSGLKCFLVIFDRSIHFLDLNRISFQSSDTELGVTSYFCN